MSVLSQARRSMRIIALPLTRRTAKHEALTYYQFITPPEDPTKQPNLLKRATGKASELWQGFGKAEGGWKLKTFQYGERLMDRLEFEELALSGLDPSLGPKISKLGNPQIKINTDEKGPSPILLVHPTFHAPPPPLSQLHALLNHRKPRHRKGFLTWMAIAPFTAPFMIIPIIPNLPFFFCVWRSWSHWRAYKASDYLDTLLQHGAIFAEANPKLDAIYASHPPAAAHSGSAEEPAKSETRSTSASASSEPQATQSTSPPTQPHLLLSKDAVPAVLSLFDLPPSSAAEIYRAIDQAARRTTDKA